MVFTAAPTAIFQALSLRPRACRATPNWRCWNRIVNSWRTGYSRGHSCFPKTTGAGGRRDNSLRARALLAEAGWTVQGGRLVDVAGQPFEIEFLTLSANDKRTLLPYMAQLRRLGIASNIRFVESPQYVSRLRQFDYDALLRSLAYGFPPGVEIRAYFNSQVANTPNTGNYAGISSPIVDALVSEVLGARRKEQLIAASRALDRTLLWGLLLHSDPWHPAAAGGVLE